jgi:hypothetical protein
MSPIPGVLGPALKTPVLPYSQLEFWLGSRLSLLHGGAGPAQEISVGSPAAERLGFSLRQTHVGGASLTQRRIMASLIDPTGRPLKGLKDNAQAKAGSIPGGTPGAAPSGYIKDASLASFATAP